MFGVEAVEGAGAGADRLQAGGEQALDRHPDGRQRPQADDGVETLPLAHDQRLGASALIGVFGRPRGKSHGASCGKVRSAATVRRPFLQKGTLTTTEE